MVEIKKKKLIASKTTNWRSNSSPARATMWAGCWPYMAKTGNSLGDVEERVGKPLATRDHGGCKEGTRFFVCSYTSFIYFHCFVF